MAEDLAMAGAPGDGRGFGGGMRRWPGAQPPYSCMTRITSLGKVDIDRDGRWD